MDRSGSGRRPARAVARGRSAARAGGANRGAGTNGRAGGAGRGTGAGRQQARSRTGNGARRGSTASRGAQGQGGRAQGGRGAASQQRRRSAPEPAARRGTPPLVLGLMIGIPAIALIGVLAYKFRPGNEPPPPPPDPNVQITDLKEEIPKIKADWREVRQLIQNEDPSVSQRVERLNQKIDAWFAKWAEVFSEHLNEDGDLPDELKGYNRFQAEMGQLRHDIIKSTNF